jgi:hypothetical protein
LADMLREVPIGVPGGYGGTGVGISCPDPPTATLPLSA